MMTATEVLTHALARLELAGRTWPCRNRPEWLSDSAEDRAEAAEACQPCPALTECAAAAQEAREKWHVWGGVDFAAKPKRRKTA